MDWMQAGNGHRHQYFRSRYNRRANDRPERGPAQGWQSFEGGDYAKAVELFKGALQNNNLYTDAYNGLGWSYGRMDSLDKAKVDFDIALGLDNTFIDAYAGRSFVSLAQGRYAEAIEPAGRSGRRGRTKRQDVLRVPS